MQDLKTWIEEQDIHWSASLFFLLLAIGLTVWLARYWLARKRFADRDSPDPENQEKRFSARVRSTLIFAALTMVWGLTTTILQAVLFLESMSYYTLACNFAFSVVMAGIFIAIQMMLSIQHQLEDNSKDLKEARSGIEKSRTDPRSLQALHDDTRKFREQLGHQTEEIRHLALRDKQMVEVIESTQKTMKTIDVLRMTAVRAGSPPLLHITNHFVREFFDGRFVIEDKNQAQIRGRQTSIDAYMALWQFLLEKQQKDRHRKIVVRALHAVPLSLWSFNPSTGQGKRSEELLDVQRRFIDAGGRFYRIAINKDRPNAYKTILDRMRDAGLDVVYIHCENRGYKYKLPNAPRGGFVWVPDYEYGQGWTLHSKDRRRKPIVTRTHMRWSKAARHYEKQWDFWVEHVKELNKDGDKRLRVPDGVEIT